MKSKNEPITVSVDPVRHAADELNTAKDGGCERKPLEVETLLVETVQRNPFSWRAAQELGDFYKREEKSMLALDYYRKATELSPKSGADRALIFREYGILLRNAGTLEASQKAIDALEIALEEAPNDPLCIFFLAEVLCRRQMFVRALPLLETLGRLEV